MQATAKDLRFHATELLNAVKRGEEVIITFRGSPCAKLVPFDNSHDNAQASDLFGIWEDNQELEQVDGYIRGLRKGRFSAD